MVRINSYNVKKEERRKNVSTHQSPVLCTEKKYVKVKEGRRGGKMREWVPGRRSFLYLSGNPEGKIKRRGGTNMPYPFPIAYFTTLVKKGGERIAGSPSTLCIKSKGK